jgi:ferredoxin
MLKKIRITLATVFFIGITLLFLDFTGTLHAYLGWMAKVQFLPALLALNVGVIVALVLITLIFGRIYCSVICPLGILQDLIWAPYHKHHKNSTTYSPAISWLRYLMLAVMVVAFIAGIGSLVALFAPYSSYGRIVQNIFQPIYIFGNNLLAALAEKMDSYAFYSREVWIRSLPTFIIAIVTFIIIFILARKNGRTYCNTICPVGTVLSFFARFSWLKIYFNEDKCRKCSKCTKNCKASCIDFTTHKVDYSRCIVCGDCLGECKFDALHYGHPKASQKPIASEEKPSEEKVDTAKRNFLVGAVLATSASAFAQKAKQVEGGLAKIEDKIAPERTTRITPPGSQSLRNFYQHCTACQLCVAECPNDVLRPSTDLQHIMQPTMSYERGYCRPECTRCSEVCPAGAILKIDKATKSSTQIGHAVWIKNNCVVLRDGVECGNCERHCPTGAITMVPYQTKDGEVQVPAVDETRCIGCGACENLCPARPFSAIYVEGHEVHKTY